MSYRKSHIKRKIHNIKPRKSIFKKLWFWILLLIFIAIIGAAYLFLFYPGIQVKNIIISGNDKTTTQELQDLILNNAGTGLIKFLGVNITSDSIFLVDTNKIDKEILQKFPIIEKVSMNKNFPQTLILGVTERNPVGIYCPGDNYGQAGNNCFLIDDSGVIFAPLSVPENDYFIVRQVASDNNVYTGENVINQNIINAISEIKKDLQDNFQINLTEALVESPIRLNVKTDQGWQIYLNLQGDPDINSQITKLNLLLNGDINPNVRKTLQYIDLRFEDRAYYK